MSLAKLKDAAERSAIDIELAQLKAFYIPLNCQPSQQSTSTRSTSQRSTPERSKVEDEISKFLADPHHRVCLLLGGAGTGKTTFTYLLQQQLWGNFQVNTRIPIRIDLKRFTEAASSAAVKGVVKEALKTDKQVETLAENKFLEFLFIFDGLDELSGGGIPNLWESNKLNEWGKPGTSKAIITCRPEYFVGNKTYKTILGPTNVEGVSQLSEWYLSSLDHSQIKDYLRNPKARESSLSAFTESEMRNYETHLLATSDIFNILNTPFLLKVAVSALPALIESGLLSEAPKRQLMRVDLYDGFMQTWFEREQKKLAAIVKGVGEVVPLFKGFSQQLAFAMFKTEVNQIERIEEQPQVSKFMFAPKQKTVTSNPKRTKLVDIWKSFFADNSDETKLARRGCPLRCVGGNEYSFVHKSFLEYFAADYLWSSLSNNDEEDTTVDWGARFLANHHERQWLSISLLSGCCHFKHLNGNP